MSSHCGLHSSPLGPPGILPILLFATLNFGGLKAAQNSDVNFNRDIRPILSDNCYACHGPDSEKRKAGLRLDRQEGALAELKSGHHAIVPHKLDQSALIARITAKDEDERMPPLKTGKHLTQPQIDLLTRWVANGATWQKHWSFIPPERPPLPPVENARWPQNPIDRFVLARLQRERLGPTPEASRTTLIRRLTFDLTGLPPTPSEVDAFLKDHRPDAYERLVDRLLASPRFGEHEAHYWLDAARYGDTHGLHLDNERSLWPYRDWIINAFNKNMRFDEFTVEQLAGDLLPGRSQAQQIATGFNRCNVSTSEGGAIDEEFYVRYAVDRTETTATVWMGLTVGCAVCHDHKYDPITQREFYRLYAFFNNVSEKAMDGNALLPPPILKLPTSEQTQKIEALNQRQRGSEERLREESARIHYEEPPSQPKAGTNFADLVWVDDDFPLGASPRVNDGSPATRWTNEAKYSGEKALIRSDKGLAQDTFTGAQKPLLVGEGDKIFAYVFLDPADPPKAIMLQYHTTEWLHRANWGDEDAIGYGDKGTSRKYLAGSLPESGRWVRLEIAAAKLGLKPGAKIDGMAFTQFGGTVRWDHAGIVTATPQEDASALSLLAWVEQEKAKENSDVPKEILTIIKLASDQRTEEQNKLLRDYYISRVYLPARHTFEPVLKEIADAKKSREELENSIPATMVMQDLDKPRGAFVLKRGEYDKRGEPVDPGVPAVLPPLPTGTTTNRLDLARWLVSKEHPLTARVTVNRLWQQFFGIGLVKTANDFGAQGEWPSHPELLDWLACELRDGSAAPPSADKPSASAWDLKHLIRLIVTSATYRQDSRATPKLFDADPDNRLLARGPRFRLDAEMIRDNALYVSGLLVEKSGGHSVRPYQPEGIWEAVGYTSSNTAKFSQDHGEALYRRSLYTFWKRTAPPPSLVTFDAPSRERFCVRRERTDTPLQALVTMNDPQFVEAARNFGQRLIEAGPDADHRLVFGFRSVTARYPSRSEKAILKNMLEKLLVKYQKDTDSAEKLVTIGESAPTQTIQHPELAAYTMVASLLLNLDETLNH